MAAIISLTCSKIKVPHLIPYHTSRRNQKKKHISLGNQIETFGISGNLLAWIKSFITGRRQRVVVNSAQNLHGPQVTSGVPQGSALGPLLFTLFVSDFSKAFDKVDHGILLHKLRAVGIIGNIGIWLFHFLTVRSYFVRLPGGISEDHPVLSGVPQGTVLGPLLFLIMISNIDMDVSASKLVSFADDTQWLGRT